MAAMVDQDFRHWSSTAAAADVTLKGLVVQTLSPDLDSGNKKTRNFVPLKVVGARVSQKIIINLLNLLLINLFNQLIISAFNDIHTGFLNGI